MTTAKVPHVRIVAPKAQDRGTMHRMYGYEVFITLPGEPEKKLSGLTGWEMSGSVEDVERVTLHLVATLEVEWVDG